MKQKICACILMFHLSSTGFCCICIRFSDARSWIEQFDPIPFNIQRRQILVSLNSFSPAATRNENRGRIVTEMTWVSLPELADTWQKTVESDKQPVVGLNAALWRIRDERSTADKKWMGQQPECKWGKWWRCSMRAAVVDALLTKKQRSAIIQNQTQISEPPV